MKTRYGASPWIHQFPASRVPDYPRFTGERTCDVVVIGGGLTGCAIAYACGVAGIKAVVVEANRIGRGSSGHSAGLLLPEPGPSFRDLSSTHGLRAARRIFEAWRRGSADAASVLRRTGIKCDLRPLDLVTVASRDGEKLLRRDTDARIEAGLDVRAQTPRQASTLVRRDVALAVREADAFALDPYRACVGLASAATKRLVKIFEKSAATKIRAGRTDVEVTTAGGVLRAETVIVATGSATPEFKPLRRHFTRRQSYSVLTQPVPAAIRKQLFSDAIVLSDAVEPRRRVHWTKDARLIISGGDQAEVAARLRDGALIQRTGQLMYELLTMYPAISGLMPEYGWDATYGETADGVMYIGAHRNYPRHLFAIGGRRDSVTGSFLAARILVRALRESPDKGDDVFAFAR